MSICFYTSCCTRLRFRGYKFKVIFFFNVLLVSEFTHRLPDFLTNLITDLLVIICVIIQRKTSSINKIIAIKQTNSLT